MSGAKVLVGDMDTGVMTQNHTKPVSLQDLQAKIAGPAKTVLKEIKLGWILST